MARLKPGVTMAQAQADVSAIAASIRDKDKRDRTFTISVVPLLEQVVGNVRRARARAAGIGDAGAADRLRQRRQPAADARHRASEGSGDPHGARRGLAAPRAAAADGERAARPHRRRRRPADRVGRALRRSHGQSGQHPAARRHRHRRRRAGVHVRRVDPDRHRLRPRAGVARRAASISTRRSRPAAGARRAMAASAPPAAGCAACWSWPRSRSR